MNAWDMWKKGFDAWENETAKFLENVIKSPMVLAPSGAMITMLMKAKTASDKAKAMVLGTVGLPTRLDQERVLHALNKLESGSSTWRSASRIAKSASRRRKI